MIFVLPKAFCVQSLNLVFVELFGGFCVLSPRKKIFQPLPPMLPPKNPKNTNLDSSQFDVY